jgi:hypothetical protein
VTTTCEFDLVAFEGHLQFTAEGAFGLAWLGPLTPGWVAVSRRTPCSWAVQRDALDYRHRPKPLPNLVTAIYDTTLGSLKSKKPHVSLGMLLIWTLAARNRSFEIETVVLKVVLRFNTASPVSVA